MRVLFISIILFIKSINAFSQKREIYDSLHVFYIKFSAIFPTFLSEGSVRIMGDSVFFYNKEKICDLRKDLYAVKKKTNNGKLKKIRNDFSPSSIDIRLLFEFYRNGNVEYKVGVSYLPLMFINNLVYEADMDKLKCISKFSEKLFYESGLDGALAGR